MRIDQLTFTRFIAAISIVIFHYGHETIFFQYPFFQKIFSLANVGVSYFFVLSGFVLIIAYKNKAFSFFNFYKNRFARIYPLYFFALFCVLVLRIVQKDSIYFGELFFNITALQSWLPNYPLSLNSPGWSISVEMFFYLLFPFLNYYVYQKTKDLYIVLLVILFWIVSQIILNFFIHIPIDSKYINSTNLYYIPLLHLNEFLIGNIIGIYFLNYKDKIKIKYKSLIVLSLLLMLIFLLYYPLPFNYHNGFLVVIFAPIIFLLSYNNSIVSNLFRNKVCVFLGEISFSIYILQMPFYLLFKSSCKLLHLDFNFYLFLLLLIMISAITYLKIEKPINKYLINLKI